MCRWVAVMVAEEGDLAAAVEEVAAVLAKH